jgi:hypothetical protein
MVDSITERRRISCTVHAGGCSFACWFDDSFIDSKNDGSIPRYVVTRSNEKKMKINIFLFRLFYCLFILIQVRKK